MLNQLVSQLLHRKLNTRSHLCCPRSHPIEKTQTLTPGRRLQSHRGPGKVDATSCRVGSAWCSIAWAEVNRDWAAQEYTLHGRHCLLTILAGALARNQARPLSPKTRRKVSLWDCCHGSLIPEAPESGLMIVFAGGMLPDAWANAPWRRPRRPGGRRTARPGNGGSVLAAAEIGPYTPRRNGEFEGCDDDAE